MLFIIYTHIFLQNVRTVFLYTVAPKLFFAKFYAMHQLLVSLWVFLDIKYYCYLYKTTSTYYYLHFTVPIPSVTINVLNNQTVGQPLILECDVTAVRGITSRVDIMWINNGSVLSIIENVNGTLVMNDVVLFTTTYNIPQLSTGNENDEYQCEVSIDTDLPVIATESVILNVTGKYIMYP